MARVLTRAGAKALAKDKVLSRQDCKPVGVLQPVVNRNKCEGKNDCVEVCPYDVFEVRRIDDADFARLSFIGKLKSRAHGRKTAYTPRAAECHACGLCVVACPEKAITLQRPGSVGDIR